MRIHGIVYVLLGAFISGTSFFLFKGNQQLMFYIVAGALVSFGVVKLIIDRVREPKYEQMPRQKQEISKRQQETPYQPNQQYRYCHNCGTIINYSQNFCHKCGARVR